MSAYNLDGLYIRIQDCPDGVKLCDHFAELGAFKEFLMCDEDRIKIAILSGDIDSPFVRIKDRETMLKAIFDHLTIDVEREKLLFKDILFYRDDLTSFAWLRYLQILHETDFINWQIAKKDFEFFLLKANEKQGEETDIQYYKKRNEIRERIKELGQEVRNIEAKIFPDSKAAREASLAESKRKVKLYSEMYAEPYTYI